MILPLYNRTNSSRLLMHGFQDPTISYEFQSTSEHTDLLIIMQLLNGFPVFRINYIKGGLPTRPLFLLWSWEL